MLSCRVFTGKTNSKEVEETREMNRSELAEHVLKVCQSGKIKEEAMKHLLRVSLSASSDSAKYFTQMRERDRVSVLFN